MDLYFIGKKVCQTFFALMYGMEVKGTEKIPQDGGVLLCANHIHNFDPPLVGVATPRVVHFMAKAELFNVPVLKHIIKRIHAFPVRRGMSDKQALKNGLNLLKEGKVLGLFPEGHRSKTGELGEGLAGAGFFALKTDAAVIPCAIIGKYKFRKKLKVVYGEPIDFKELKEQKVSAKEATDLIMEHIRRLINENQ